MFCHAIYIQSACSSSARQVGELRKERGGRDGRPGESTAFNAGHIPRCIYYTAARNLAVNLRNTDSIWWEE